MENQGRYTCTPYNAHRTAGSSGLMEVMVREPPTITVRPAPINQRRIDDDVTMSCEAKGTPSPTINWRRVGIAPLPPYTNATNEKLLIFSDSLLSFSDILTSLCYP